MLSTAKSTKMPPCGARTATSIAMDSPPVTALPSMIAGITRNGSAAANGIAPSVMKDARAAQPALPFSCSAYVEELGRTTVASASASGGTMPASMTAAMIFSSGESLAAPAAPTPAAAKLYATLFSGPPMSKAIIRPRITPRMIATAAQVVQALGELVHQPGDRLAEHDDHQQADDDRREERDDHHRHQAAGPGRHLPAADPVGDHTGEHAADDARR